LNSAARSRSRKVMVDLTADGLNFVLCDTLPASCLRV
jgi:hypothetical protein